MRGLMVALFSFLLSFVHAGETSWMLSGRVVVPITGAPVGGAVVAASLESPSTSAQGLIVSTTADAEGRFQLQGLLAGGRYLVTATAEGFVAERVHVSPRNTRPLQIVLRPGAALAGFVKRATVGTMPNITVELTGSRNHVRTVPADASGTFRFTGLDNDTVSLRAYGGGLFTWKPAEGVRVRLGQETEAAALTLEPGWRAALRITDATGGVVPGAVLLCDAPATWLPARTPVDATEVKLGPLPPWQCSVVVAAPGCVARVLGLEARDATPAAVRILSATLAARPRIHGRVVDTSGQPVAGAKLSYRFAQVDRLTGETGCEPVADASGAYAFLADVAEGNLSPRVAAAGYVPARPRLAASGDRVQDITLTRMGSLHGRVRLAEGGPPAGGEVVYTRNVSFPKPTPGRTSIDAGGAWRVAELAPAAYTLVAESAQLVSLPVQVKVREGEDKEAPELVLIHGLRFGGQVLVEGTEEPVAGIRVTLSAANLPSWSALSERDGRFAIGPVPAGDYTCTVADERPEEERLEVFNRQLR